MSFTFKLLRQKNPEVLEYYQQANELWAGILADYDGSSTKLSGKLSSAQFDFERISGRSDRFDRWDMQEVMVFSGLTYFLDNGSEEEMRNAQSVAEAFEMSYCSIEVKGLAKRFAKMLHLGGFSV